MRSSSASPTALDLTASVRASAPRRALPERVPREHVLLLDDDDDFRSVLSDYLTTRLYAVTQVANGADGVREIVRQPFDLILCDMMMPRVDGEMFYWAVNRLRPAARLRFLFLTGHRHDARVQSFFRRIDATVVTKPFNFETLNGAIIDVQRKIAA